MTWLRDPMSTPELDPGDSIKNHVSLHVNNIKFMSCAIVNVIVSECKSASVSVCVSENERESFATMSRMCHIMC